jgi:copper chaperone
MRNEAHFSIDGMSCQMCVRHVTNALKALPGVELDDVQVGMARVHYDPALVKEPQILSALQEAGYTARITS